MLVEASTRVELPHRLGPHPPTQQFIEVPANRRSPWFPQNARTEHPLSWVVKNGTMATIPAHLRTQKNDRHSCCLQSTEFSHERSRVNRTNIINKGATQPKTQGDPPRIRPRTLNGHLWSKFTKILANPSSISVYSNVFARLRE